MTNITEKEFLESMDLIKKNNESIERCQKLKAEKNKYKKHYKLPSTSKIVLFCMIAICIEIIVFVEYSTIVLSDTNALYSLVGIPVALAPTIWGYYSKSKAENTKGGIIYESAMMGFNNDCDLEECSENEICSEDAEG